MMRRLLLVVSAAALLFASCSSGADLEACSMAGCMDGVYFRVDQAWAADWDFPVEATVCIGEACEVTTWSEFEPSSSLRASAEIPESVRLDRTTIHLFRFTAVDSTGAVVLERHYDGTLHRASPNGDDCGPICWSYSNDIGFGPDDVMRDALIDADSTAVIYNALHLVGADIDELYPAEPFPFSARVGVISVDGHEVRIYDYPSLEDRVAETDQIRMAGWSVGGNPVEWIGTPHYWNPGRFIVLYLGDDPGTLETLTAALGPEWLPPSR